MASREFVTVTNLTPLATYPALTIWALLRRLWPGRVVVEVVEVRHRVGTLCLCGKINYSDYCPGCGAERVPQ